jgi:regulator of protease activity HflC (stomatin/prohibitin superfamily)
LPIRDKVKEVTIQPIQLDHRVEVGKDGAITKDNQTIGAEITVFYKYKVDDLTTMYRQYGEKKMESIVNQTLRESFKTIIGGYDIFKLPTIQDEIRGKVWQDFQSKLTAYPIEVTELKIVNYDWSEQFDAQIAETMNRSQQVKQKEQELLISQNEQQKKVKEADAEKQATVVRAEGARDAAKLQAEAKALEGEGIKKYNESIASKWDIELKKMELEIAKIKAEKWNGVFVPTNNYSPIPLQIGDIQGR